MKPSILSVEDFQSHFFKLEELGKKLEALLSEYLSLERRNEAEELKSLCDPWSCLLSFTPCQVWYELPEDIDQMMRDIRLEKELIACKSINKLIASWSGNPALDVYEDGFHPWLNDLELKEFPETLFFHYESIVSAYYQCMHISSRWSAWDLYRNSIFQQRGDGSGIKTWEDAKDLLFLTPEAQNRPQISDLNIWEEMQKNYFSSRSLRREFLENMYSALKTDEEEIDQLESGEEDSYLEQDHEADSIYGFVYLIRNGDLCKIGITENFLRRIDQLKPDEVLNVVRCENFKELEKDLHSFFKDVRLPQTEYFRLSREQINKAHKLMTSLARF